MKIKKSKREVQITLSQSEAKELFDSLDYDLREQDQCRCYEFFNALEEIVKGDR